MAEDFKTKIIIDGDDSGASSALSRVTGALRNLGSRITGIGAAIGRFMSAFSRLTWVVQSVQLVVEGFQRLREWMHRAATAAHELQDALARQGIDTAAAHAAEAYKRLNKELAETNRLESERNAILDARKTRERDLADASLERDKQMEIAKLDPASSTYAEDRAAIERKYARRSSETAAARAAEDNREQSQRLYAEADQKDREANKLQQLYDRQMRIHDRSVERSWQLGMDARRGVEGAQEKHDEEETKGDQIFDAAQKTKEAMEALRREADSIRSRAAEMTGGSRLGAIRSETEQRRIDNEERDARQRRDDAEAQRLYAEAKRKEAQAAALEKAIKANAPSSVDVTAPKSIPANAPSSVDVNAPKSIPANAPEAVDVTAPKSSTPQPLNISTSQLPPANASAAAELLRKEAEELKSRALALSRGKIQKSIDADAEQKRVDDEITRLNEERRAKEEERTKKEKQASALESFAEEVSSFDGVSQNRLTAMGLGSGVSASGGVASDVRRIVDLLKQEIAATKNIKPAAEGPTTFEE